VSVNETDLEYLRHGDLSLLARLYQPAGSGPFPAIVDVHGGAWTMSDRLGNATIDRHLAENGICVLALDFRMPPVAKYPALIADVNAGIRWLKAHAAEFGSRPELVGGLGTSSGGHVIMVNALRPNDPQYASISVPEASALTAELAYVAALWPIVDPLARYRMARERNNAQLVGAHDAFWAGEAEMEAGSATAILERGEATHLPPALVIQGTADENVTPDMAARFAAAYRQCGGALQLELFAEQPHTFIKTDMTSEHARRGLGAIVEFIHRHAAAPVQPR
jgi:acetyl esterase